jgi:hypothetical protein
VILFRLGLLAGVTIGLIAGVGAGLILNLVLGLDDSSSERLLMYSGALGAGIGALMGSLGSTRLQPRIENGQRRDPPGAPDPRSKARARRRR